ncbi:uncharacterized protein LOC122260513 [Penaeus japonicus]|uniref:uncharacterized protein LOC122260513 n=1 Tax=Penaeus japonicus TaxID=27405 RepID=UPI001C7127B5|nr:uncharacterized protein LOC122260513 [Penaeus japonicus]
MRFSLNLVLTTVWITTAATQDYQVADINCDFSGDPDGLGQDRLSARLKKPPAFKGHPLFADDRRADPFSDDTCQIRQDLGDSSGLVYNLLVTDLAKCGVVKKDGYVNLRVWFPQLEGVVLATDQEVIIMCKPASPTIIENRAAGFAGALPSAGRVSGVVEETPGRLEYEVALYREVKARTGETHAPVDQAVPIGSRLQLRAKINTQSTWKYVKLMEVTVSSDPTDPYASGHVALVKDGCRQPDFSSIVPHQPRRPSEDPGEVRLDFEAFMLDSKMAASSQLWIHASVKACIDSRDCLPEFCLDLFQPSGHGRRRRRRKTTFYTDGVLEVSASHGASLSALLPSRTPRARTPAHVPAAPATPAQDSGRNVSLNLLPEAKALSASSAPGSSAKIGDNIGVTVIMPEEFFSKTEAMYQSCATFMVLSGFLGLSLLLAAGFLCFLTSRLHKTVIHAHTSSLDTVIKEHHQKYGLRDFLDPPFQ